MIHLTDDQIRSIYTSTAPARIEAQRYGVKPTLIRSIRDRSIFSYITIGLKRPTKAKPVQPAPINSRPHRRHPTTPGIDFAALVQSHQNLERPRTAVRRLRLKPGYKGAREIIAYLIPLIG
ncbi:hypothetical protein [Reyranella massiliensis]|uniref:hypothetical protein n=1 Tax=Reyranella massiliensis TaxID=445220 RepID=UPI001C07A192|nr:hypothetical protein [Reyranella massiliensis]